MKLAGRCDKGVLRQSNQDRYRVLDLSDDFLVAIVCDGMGGTNGGDLASRLACDVIAEKLQLAYRTDMDENSVRNAMLSAVAAANSVIFDKGLEDKTYFGMGTTVVVAAVTPKVVQIVHVGDSRAYHYADGQLRQITSDHSFVQELVDKGEITADAAYAHPQKNLITRAVGVESEVAADYDEVELKSGDRILLSTDGLTNMCTDDEISSILGAAASPEETADALVRAANENGGADNITALIIQI